jgi:autotransporter-associated beta strand protein
MKKFSKRVSRRLGLALFCAAITSQAIGQTNFAVLGNDGAWTWYNDPRALFHNGKLYFGSVRAADSKTVLSVFDLSTGAKTDLWASGFTQLDDHNNPGLLVKQDHTMLAIYSRHISDQFFAWRLSNNTNPVAPANWGAELRIPASGAGMTYANPFQLSGESGKIYNFCRNQNFNPTIYTSSDGGASWSAPQPFIQTGTGGTVRPYLKYTSDGFERFDFLYTDGHPRDVSNSLYHLYYQRDAFYKTDGTLVKNFASLPILHDSGQRGSVIYQYSDAAQPDPNQWIPTGRAWCWEIARPTNSAPVCVFTVQRDLVTGTNSGVDDRIYYYYARWTGTHWQKCFIAHAGRPLYVAEDDYAGGICLDPQEPNAIYISSNAADPFNLADTTNVPLRANSRYELWRGVTSDGGLNFTWSQITSNSPMDNLRPYIPRRNGGEPCVIWFRGTYSSYTAYSCQIVGRFTTKVPLPASASGSWRADASGSWSESGNWTEGFVAQGADNMADFSALDLAADRTVTLDSPRSIGTLKFGDIAGTQGWNLSGVETLTLSGTAPSIVVNQNTATVTTPLGGTNGFTKSGAGALVLNATNSLSGVLNLDRGIDGNNNDGATCIANPGALGGITAIALRNTSVSTAGGATLQLDGSSGELVVTQNITATCRNNGTTPAFENLAGSNTLTGDIQFFTGGTNVNCRALAGSQLTFGGSMQYVGNLTAGRNLSFFGSGDIVVAGPILNSTNGALIRLVKSDTGRLTLAGTNAYTGGTAITGGTLVVDGELGAGAVSVAGGTLSGSGRIAGAVTVSPGAVLAPGTLMISNSLSLAGTTRIRLNAASVTNDSVRGLTSVSYGGTLTLTNMAGVLATNRTFKIFSAGNYHGMFVQISPAAPGPGLVWNTNTLATDGTLRLARGNLPSPTLGGISFSGSDLIVSGTGGYADGDYWVLVTTNLALALSNWVRVATNRFDLNGNFACALSVTPVVSQLFFRIQLP